MAVFNLNNYTDADGLGFPKNFRRGAPNPLDNSSVWASFEAAQDYAINSPIAYVGQELAVVDIDNGNVKYYGIQDEAGTLKEIGSGVVPIGDNKTIFVAEDGTVQLYGIDTANDETKKYQAILENGILTWVELDSTAIDNLRADVTEIQQTVYGKEATDGTEAVAGLVDLVNTNKSDIADINAKIGDVADDKTLVEMIVDAEANATYDDTAISNRVKAIEDDHLKTSDKDELLAAIATAKTEATNDAVNTILGENIDVDFDTLQEIADWIKSDTTNSAELINRVTAIEEDYLKGADKSELQTSINELKTFVGTLPEGATSSTVVAYISEVVDALNIGDYAKATELTSLAGRVGALETDVSELKAAGAEKNIIQSVDTEQFNIDENRKLTLLDVAMSKVTGLETALEGKVEKIDGYRLISPDEAEKLAKLVLNDDGSVEVSGEINASNVKELNTWITTNRDTVPGLLSTSDAAIIERLQNVEAGAEVNTIVAIKLGDNESTLPLTDRIATIPVATAEQYGVVLSSAEENKVAVRDDGTMEVNSLNVNKLTQSDDEYIILNGGSSSTLL